MSDISWQSLNWFDIVVISILGLSALVSILRGFIREIISIVTWLVAIIVALKYALPASDSFSQIIESSTARYIVAFIIILFGVLILGIIVNSILRRLMKKSSVSVLDRLLGFFFGVGRGILLVGLILLLLRVSSLQDAPMLQKSELAPRFNGIVSWLHDFLPNEIQQISKWTKDNSSIPIPDLKHSGFDKNATEATDKAKATAGEID